MQPKPQVTKTVLYNHRGSAQKRSPAIIQKVNTDGTLDLAVLSVNGSLFFRNKVKKGMEGRTWDWAVRA